MRVARLWRDCLFSLPYSHMYQNSMNCLKRNNMIHCIYYIYIDNHPGRARWLKALNYSHDCPASLSFLAWFRNHRHKLNAYFVSKEVKKRANYCEFGSYSIYLKLLFKCMCTQETHDQSLKCGEELQNQCLF